MKRILLSLSALIVLALPGVASADTITYKAPLASNAQEGGDFATQMDHYDAYKWTIDKNTKGVGNKTLDLQGKQLTSLTLTFDNIRNWDASKNTLYINFLGNTGDAAGAKLLYDGLGNGNFFAGSGVLLASPSFGVNATDYTLTINDQSRVTLGGVQYNALALLNQYFATNNIFTLGFDPDCHYYYSGIEMTINTKNTPTAPVPEPATMMLLGTGLAGAAAKMRRRRQAQTDAEAA